MVGEFYFYVKYIRGEDNSVADSLSRIFNIAEVDTDGEMIMDNRTLQEAQKRDPERKALFKAVSKNYTRKPTAVSHDMWSFKRKCSTSLRAPFEVNECVFVPKGLRKRVLTATHYGHQGIENMLTKLSTDYFWPKMKNDVRDFVRNCRICSLVKPKFINAELKPYLLDAPMQLVVTDIGPLPTDKGSISDLAIFSA